MRYIKPIAAFALAGLLLSDPEAAALGAIRAMADWYVSVAPALFPFLVLLPLLTCAAACRLYEALLGAVTRRLFNLPGAAASAMAVGMLSGAPSGAIAARRIAAREGMNRGQLSRLAVATAGFSPAFLVAGVGAGMLGSVSMGWKLLAAQVSTQLILATALRGAWPDMNQPVEALPDGESQPVRTAVLAVLTVCGYMTLFGAICAALATRLGGIPSEVLLCLLDMPSGARLVADLPMAEASKPLLLAAMCGFGGGCVATQNLEVLKGCGVIAWEYLAVRVLAAVIEMGCMALLLRLPELNMVRMGGVLRENPLAAAALFASMLSLPVVLKMGKSVS